jgi:hypothetical protein
VSGPSLFSRLVRVGLLAALAAPASSLDAARFPDSVARRFEVTGEAAQAWAALLGLDAAREARIALPLSANHLHAVGLRTRWPVDPATVRNALHYAPGPPARLVLEGEWLDSTTGSRAPVPRFTFGSESLGATAPPGSADPWQGIARHLDLPRAAAAGPPAWGAVLVERSSDPRRLPWLSLVAYRVQLADGAWGYQVEIGVDDRPAAARARAMADFAARRRTGSTSD